MLNKASEIRLGGKKTGSATLVTNTIRLHPYLSPLFFLLSQSYPASLFLAVPFYGPLPKSANLFPAAGTYTSFFLPLSLSVNRYLATSYLTALFSPQSFRTELTYVPIWPCSYLFVPPFLSLSPSFPTYLPRSSPVYLSLISLFYIPTLFSLRAALLSDLAIELSISVLPTSNPRTAMQFHTQSLWE